MTINSSTSRADIFKEFIKVLKDNLTTTGVQITDQFSNDPVNMPQIVVGSPLMPRIRNGFGTNSNSYIRDGSMAIEIYTTNTPDAIKLADDVDNTLITHQDELGVQNLALGDSDATPIEMGASQIVTITIPITFMFRR